MQSNFSPLTTHLPSKARITVNRQAENWAVGPLSSLYAS